MASHPTGMKYRLADTKSLKSMLSGKVLEKIVGPLDKLTE